MKQKVADTCSMQALAWLCKALISYRHAKNYGAFTLSYIPLEACETALQPHIQGAFVK